MTSRLFQAVAASAAVVLSAPVAGQLTVAVRTALPGRFAFAVSTALAALLAAAIGTAAFRVRERRAPRFVAMATALVIAAVYAGMAATGTPETDAVERLHFIEFGIVAWLFYRAWYRLGTARRLAATCLCGVLVAVADEWLQWFVPIRIGEFRDILIDAVAVGCGALFSIGVDPPARAAGNRGSGLVAMLAAAAIVAVAVFVDSVHLGYEVDAGRTGRFRSHYTADQLLSLEQVRRDQWREHPPVTLRRYSREDQYLTEASWHIQRRNSAWADGRAFVAWHENLILEMFYAPALDTPSYAARLLSRWSPEHREDARRRAQDRAEPYLSDAERLPLLTWPQRWFWSAAIVIAGAASVLLRRRQGAALSSST